MIETATIQDVARLAGVSSSTVSNFLNGRFERMRPATTVRIQRAISQLGYTPSNVARHLKTGHVSMLGLIVPSVANPVWALAARYVEECALAHGYQVLLCNAERDPDREQRYAEALWASGVRGVVFASSPLTFDHVQHLASRGLRVVAFDRNTQRADRVVSDTVGIDNVQASRLAVEHLLALGHRRIGFISGPIRTVSRIDRQAGYQEALRHAGIEPDPTLVWTGSSNDQLGDKEGAEFGRAGTRALLSATRPPTALVALNDMYAFGAYAAIREVGWSVPAAMSVVGFDDISPFSEIAQPPLTTVRQPIQEMMRIVVERLIQRVENTRTGPPEHTILAPTLIVRASTAAPTLEPA